MKKTRRKRGGAGPFLRASLSGAFRSSIWTAPAIPLCCLACLAAPGPRAEETGEPPRAARVEVDRERGEVRFPCRFVNSTRKLEVFACHESGPTHETVVAFDAEGDELYRALLAAGFRGPEFWNATSGEDLRLTGGDRAVVWIRWEWKGKTHEVPAEETLIEEGTGLPLFLRGFTFTAERLAVGDPPERRIPREVELTIGGVSRQSQSFSLLQHPNDLPELVNWIPSPEVSPRAVPDLTALVEERTPCTLIVRRLRSEAELIDLALERETDPARRAVRERERSIGREIDARKGEFEALVGQVRSLLGEGEQKRDLGDADRRSFRDRTVKLIARGAALAAQVRELYLQLWDGEEAERLLFSLRSQLDADQRAWVAIAYGSGFKFELAVAGKRREMAALRAASEAPGERDGLLQKALEAEVEALKVERERRWARFKLEHEIRPKLKELDPREDAYTYQLFHEAELRALADMRSFRARAEGAQVEARELRARAGGSPAGEKDLRALRIRIEARARLAAAERQGVELLEKIRWVRNPPGGRAETEDPKKEEERLLAEQTALNRKLKELRAALEAAGGRPSGTGEEPPDELDRKPLYPESA